MKFLFVGERPSHQAVKIGATWQNGKLAGRTLRAALVALNINPDEQAYTNLWRGPDASPADAADERAALESIRNYIDDDYIIVGMGRLVTGVLTREGISHLAMIHPAARGAIRRRDRYQAHVGLVLGVVQ